MNMNILEVVTPPPANYHDCSTRNNFWEEKFTSVNMKSCGRCNDSKHREINNGDHYIILEISYKFDYMDKREVKYS